MALVVIASAKGAPGVTTLTVALAALVPGAIAADLDPDGGDLALRYRREDGAPLDPETGLLSLAASLRRDHNEHVLQTGSLDEHLQVASGGLDVLLGFAGPDQAVGLGPLWSPLGRALAGTDRTIFADCGRLGPASPAMPVLMQADAVVMLARAELEELSHLRERLRFLTAALPGRYAGPAQVGVILVAAERDRAAGPRTEQLLRSSGLAVPVLGTVTDDPRGAARVRGLHGGRAGRTTLVRSVRSLLPAVSTLIGPGRSDPARAEVEADVRPGPAPVDPGVAHARVAHLGGVALGGVHRGAADGEPIGTEPVRFDPTRFDPPHRDPARPDPRTGLHRADPHGVDPHGVDPHGVDPRRTEQHRSEQMEQPGNEPLSSVPGDSAATIAARRRARVAAAEAGLPEAPRLLPPRPEMLQLPTPPARTPMISPYLPPRGSPDEVDPDAEPMPEQPVDSRFENIQFDNDQFDDRQVDDGQAGPGVPDEEQRTDLGYPTRPARASDDNNDTDDVRPDRPYVSEVAQMSAPDGEADENNVPEPAQNGWPGSGPDSGSLSGVTAPALQNRGR